MKKMKTALCIFFLFQSLIALSQKSLKPSRVDYWDVDSLDTKKYNRASSYVYILNHDAFINLMSGVRYNRDERKDLGIKKNDKPSLLHISMKINHTDFGEDGLTVPLLTFDKENDGSTTNFKNYEGSKIMQDVNVSNLKENVTGEVSVKAIIRNSNTQFWQSMATIAADLGKSATTLLTGSKTEAVAQLTQSVSGHINDGLEQLGKLSDGTKSKDYTFFIDIVNVEKERSEFEKVYSVRLYKIDWNSHNDEKGFFKSISTIDGKAIPSDFKANVKSEDTKTPYILVVETRSKPRIEIDRPEFSKDYLDNLTVKINNYTNPSILGILAGYKKSFRFAYDAYGNIKKYQDPSITNKEGILIELVENLYQFEAHVIDTDTTYAGSEDENISRNYQKIENAFDLIRNTIDNEIALAGNPPQLADVQGILKSIDRPIVSKSSIGKLKNEIIIIDKYYTWVANKYVNISNYSSLSFERCKSLRKRYEPALYQKLLNELDTTSSSSAKISFFDKLKDENRICQLCLKESDKQLKVLRETSLEEIIGKFQQRSQEIDNNFKLCRQRLESGLTDSIRTRIKEIPLQYDQNKATRNLLNLENGLTTWKSNIYIADIQQQSFAVISETLNNLENSIKQIRKALEFFRDEKLLGQDDVLDCGID